MAVFSARQSKLGGRARSASRASLAARAGKCPGSNDDAMSSPAEFAKKKRRTDFFFSYFCRPPLGNESSRFRANSPPGRIDLCPLRPPLAVLSTLISFPLFSIAPETQVHACVCAGPNLVFAKSLARLQARVLADGECIHECASERKKRERE